jgi:hypothetical protein
VLELKYLKKGTVMGTRGLTKVISNGETVIAQYGQWDHYPSGQGVTVLNFLSNPSNIEALKVGLTNVYYPTQEQLESIVSKYTDNAEGWMNLEQGDKYSAENPSLTRDTGAGILQVVADSFLGPKTPLILNIEFEKDELFCEGVYEVNLDENTFTTTYGKTVSFNIDTLPTIEEYISAFETIDA